MTTMTTADAEVVGRMLNNGLSLQEISTSLGWSREKVRRYGSLIGATPQNPNDWVAPQMHAFAVQVSEKICSHLDLEDPKIFTAPELRDEFPGVTTKYLRAAVDLAQCNGLLGVASPPEKVAFTDDALLQAIRDAYATVSEEVPEMTGPIYDKVLARGDIGEAPSRILIIQRIGSWAAACERAGVPYRTARRHYDGYTDADLLEWVYFYATQAVITNVPITFAGYSAWAKKAVKHGMSAPSGSLIKARFFGRMPWNEIRDKAIVHAYRANARFFARMEPAA